jgi:hypothetical protein
VVFALGELYDEGSKKEQGVPGTNYFVSAMAMFQDLYEEPSIHYIETLLLIVSNVLSFPHSNLSTNPNPSTNEYSTANSSLKFP